MTETVQSIIEEMDAATAEVAIANEKALKEAEARSRTYTMGSGESEMSEQLLAANLEAARLANEARNQPLGERLADLRERGRELLEAQRDAAEVALHKAQLAEGPQGEAWAVAEARRVFVEQDVMDTAPADIPEMYRLAMAAGDSVGGWLIARYGEQRLSELQRAEIANGDFAGFAARALAELRQQFPTSSALAAHKLALAKLAGAERELRRPRGEVELGPILQEFAATSGLKEEYLDPDLVAKATSVR